MAEGKQKRQATIFFPFGQEPGPLEAAPRYRRRPFQIFFTNDYEVEQMAAWCARACRSAFGFFVKARVVVYPSGTARIQEEQYYAEFHDRSDATAFRLRWSTGCC